MSTTIRPELSKKNKYWIERHRYYELKHFCLQYPTWKNMYNALDGMSKHSVDSVSIKVSGNGNPTERCGIAKAYYSERIAMVENVSKATDSELSFYILKAVTEGLSYESLKAKLEIPCCKDTYYELYRRFFWLLNKERE